MSPLRYSVCHPADPTPVKDPLLPSSLPPPPPPRSRTLPTSLPLSPRLYKDLPLSLPLSPGLSDTTRTLEGLSLSKEGPTPFRALANPPAKRKLLSRSHRGQYFSGPQRWLRGHSGDSLTGSLSEGVYTKQLDPDLPPPSPQGHTFISHASCVLENRKSRHRDPRPHVRRIFVEPCWDLSPDPDGGRREGISATGVSVVVAEVESGGEEPEGAAAQEVDSDEQSNAQVSEILSSTL